MPQGMLGIAVSVGLKGELGNVAGWSSLQGILGFVVSHVRLGTFMLDNLGFDLTLRAVRIQGQSRFSFWP